MTIRAAAVAVALLAGAAQRDSTVALTVRELVTFPFCDRLDATEALPPDRVTAAALSCQLHTDDLTPEQAEAELGASSLVLMRDGDRLTAFARVHGDGAMLCCSLQTGMRRLGESDYWVARFRMADLDHAMLTLCCIDPLRSPSSPAFGDIARAKAACRRKRSHHFSLIRVRRKLYKIADRASCRTGPLRRKHISRNS